MRIKLTLFAPQKYEIQPQKWVRIPLGFSLKLPSGVTVILKPVNDDVKIVNCSRDKQFLIIYNHLKEPLIINKGEKMGILEIFIKD